MASDKTRGKSLSFQCTILGSGTGIPSLNRQAPGYLLEVAEMRWLVDCGSGTLLQLERIQKSFRDLDGVFITHTHADHIGDLTPMVHAFRLPGLPRDKPFTLFGPPGFSAFFKEIVTPVVSPPTTFPFHVAEVPSAMSWGTVQILSHPTVHTDRLDSVAYRFEKNGKSIVFSGDCDFDDGIIEFATETDLLILDCSTLDANKVDGHLSAKLAGLVAAQARAKRLVPTHLYPISAADSQRIKECRTHFSGPVDLAEDLMTLRV